MNGPSAGDMITMDQGSLAKAKGSGMHQSRRVTWLDGLRGLAAFQVVLLHYATAFLPGLGTLSVSAVHYPWEKTFIRSPLFFILDGYSAVYIFFILSGAALTYSYEIHPLRFGTNFIRRVVRLGLPMAGSLIFAALLIWAMPDFHVLAGSATRSQWLHDISPREVTIQNLIYQIALDGMLAGYFEISFLPAVLRKWLDLTRLYGSLNVLLWTLHVEFVGSILILVLVACRSRFGRLAYALALSVSAALLVSTPLVMFLIGHRIARFIQNPPHRLLTSMVGAVFLIAGVSFSSGKDWVWVSAIFATLPSAPSGPPSSSFHLQSMLGAVLVFLGACFLRPAQRIFEGRLFQFLGRISFALYLVHFPILFTVSCGVFLATRDLLSYGASILLASLVGIFSSVLIAIHFEWLIDRPALQVSRKLGRQAHQRAS
jgi:peptidoglycan/LPS O-acetylase OafA/YrhL